MSLKYKPASAGLVQTGMCETWPCGAQTLLSIALILTTIHRIPASASTNQRSEKGNLLRRIPHTLHLTPYTLHPAPYNQHPATYTLNPTLYTPHPSAGADDDV